MIDRFDRGLLANAFVSLNGAKNVRFPIEVRGTGCVGMDGTVDSRCDPPGHRVIPADLLGRVHQHHRAAAMAEGDLQLPEGAAGSQRCIHK